MEKLENAKKSVLNEDYIQSTDHKAMNQGSKTHLIEANGNKVDVGASQKYVNSDNTYNDDITLAEEIVGRNKNRIMHVNHPFRIPNIVEDGR